eukprot:g2651.t2
MNAARRLTRGTKTPWGILRFVCDLSSSIQIPTFNQAQFSPPRAPLGALSESAYSGSNSPFRCFIREIRVVLPLDRQTKSSLTSSELKRQIYDRTKKLMEVTEHNLRIHRSRGLHRRLRNFVDDYCDLLASDLSNYPQSTDAKVIGASIHLLSVMQVSK